MFADPSFCLRQIFIIYSFVLNKLKASYAICNSSVTNRIITWIQCQFCNP